MHSLGCAPPERLQQYVNYCRERPLEPVCPLATDMYSLGATVLMMLTGSSVLPCWVNATVEDIEADIGALKNIKVREHPAPCSNLRLLRTRVQPKT